MCTVHDSLIPRFIDTEKMPKKRNTKKKEQKARFHMVLFEQSHMRTKIGGMDRRNDGAPNVDLWCNAQRTRPDVHRTLARVPTVCQNTADDNDNDARDHERSVRVHMPRDGSAVEAGPCDPGHTKSSHLESSRN